MTDRPIIFSAPMVRALLDGRKTQTRRVLGNSGPGRGRSNIFSAQIGWSDSYVLDPGNANWRERDTPYAPRDRLWVREAWRVGAWDWNNAQVAIDYLDGPRKEWLGVEDGDMLHRLIDQSRADARKAGRPLRDSYYEYSWAPGDSPCRWRSPIYMPRWASRLTLLVTDVRVQRLCEISVEDAVAEGIDVESDDRHKADFERAEHAKAVGGSVGCGPEVFPFKRLWNSIHGPDAWDQNPWVAAISFTVHRCNIDTMEEGTW